MKSRGRRSLTIGPLHGKHTVGRASPDQGGGQEATGRLQGNLAGVRAEHVLPGHKGERGRGHLVERVEGLCLLVTQETC